MSEFLGVGWYKNEWTIKKFKTSKRKNSLKELSWYKMLNTKNQYHLIKN